VARPFRPSSTLVDRLCLAALVANMAIVLTGALVRLTGSGLGCPTWPRCTGSSYENTPAYGVHGVIEFGNRLLTFVLVAVVATCVLATLSQRPRRRDLAALSWVLLGGIFAQAVLGGITVRTHLNPWTVAAHFLLSMALVAAAATLRAGSRPVGEAVRPVAPWLGRTVRSTAAVTAAVLVLGTVVTGSGPHAGDRSAARTGFDPAAVSHLHAAAVLLLLGLTITAVVGLRVSRAPARVRRAAAVLLGLEVAQGFVGYLQYFTGVPVALVAVHVAGACLVWLAAVSLVLSARGRPVVPPAPRPRVSVAPEAAGTR
jgi:cytochrome c oxidase assembly protein subunit 15